MAVKSSKYILWFKEISAKDVLLVGGKNASLGEMISQLTKKGINVPDGFATTSYAYWYFLKKNKILPQLKEVFKKLDVNPEGKPSASYGARDIKRLQEIGREARNLILKAEFPEDFKKEIIKAYRKLGKKYGENPDVAVRSSATAEDLPSIAGNEMVLARIGREIGYIEVEKLFEKLKENPKPVFVPSLINEKIKWLKIKELYQHPAKNKVLYKITTKSGREITITPDHSLIALEPDEFKTKITSINKLDRNTRIPVIKSLPLIGSGQKIIDVRKVIKLKPTMIENGRVKINQKNTLKEQYGLPAKISIDKEFAYFLGIYLAEGSIYDKKGCIDISCESIPIADRVKKFYKSIDSYKYKKRKETKNVRVHNVTLAALLRNTTGQPLPIKGKGRSARTKHVPDFIFSQTKEVISEFLKGLFDGDGWIDEKGIGYFSVSKKLIGGIVKLLEMLRINYYLGKMGTNITIPPSEAKKFKELINFTEKRNQKKLKKLIQNYNEIKKHQDFIDTIPSSKKISELLEEKLKPKLRLETVRVAICPKCGREMTKGGTYRDYKDQNIRIKRYFCRNCNWHPSERVLPKLKKKIVLKYIHYDRYGRFKKGALPWNKGNRKRLLTYGTSYLKKIAEQIKSKELLKIVNSDIIWDKIKKIEPIRYSGYVYDFVVPKTQNFAAGLGGIITHNTASFAGLHETYLNVSGEEELLEAVKKCIASLFNDRAISYREEKGFDHFKIALSVGVQKMVRSDLAYAGVIFTLDTETGFKDVILINSSWGLGESVVKGKVIPDEFLVFKPTLKEGFQPIISKVLGTKRRKLIYGTGNKTTFEVKVPPKDQKRFTLTDEEILQLAKWAVLIEDHYSKKAKKWLPQDIEWAKDGKTNQLFIVQSRPETVHAPREIKSYTQYILKEKGAKLLLEGEAIGSKITSGRVKIIPGVSKIKEFKPGEILVTKMTDPDWTMAMKQAKGIITQEGGRTCFNGNTKILTDKGFLPLKEVYDRLKFENLKTISLDSKNNQIAWRSILQAQKRKADVYKISISPTLRSRQNFLEVTPDHQFLTLKNRSLIKKEIDSITSLKEGILVVQKIPRLSNHYFNAKESYLLGGMLTDGHAYITNQGSYKVGFTQKIIPEKEKFIKTMNSYLKELYQKKFKLSIDKRWGGGNFGCNCKDLYKKIKKGEQDLFQNILFMDKKNLLMFLAGILDGDGNISDHQIQITLGQDKKAILQAVVIASLRLGFAPTICKRKTWFVASFDKKFASALLKFTQRLNNKYSDLGENNTKRFISKQVIGDIIDLINQRGRMKHDYLVRPNMITEFKIKKSVMPKIKEPLKSEFSRLITAPFAMQKTKLLNKKLQWKDVYNITVEAKNDLDHNYVVFTNNYTPVIVANCHAAIVSRELGTPCVVGATNALQVLKTGQNITVDCSGGQKGKIFEGQLKFEIKEYDLKKIPKTKTKIMMNTSHPDVAFRNSFLPNSGVGLAREEFIIASQIQIHPLALINYSKLKGGLRKKIDEITSGYKDKKEYFIDKLSQGIGKIGAAFWPKPVIVRFSDFKSNEYAQLLGGNLFEPKEANPMLGWRGASRYYDEKFRPAFKMEVEAIKRVREKFGLKNVIPMIPFCRTPEEGEKVLKLIEEYGLGRGKDGLRVYVMCEIPSNVILAEKFLEICDGYSIGSNDLTQAILGLDRDSALVAKVGDERNPAVKEMIAKVIQECKKRKKYCGICGEAPSVWEEFAEFLVEQGIESMSLNPDTVIKTTLIVAKKEKQLKSKT